MKDSIMMCSVFGAFAICKANIDKSYIIYIDESTTVLSCFGAGIK